MVVLLGQVTGQAAHFFGDVHEHVGEISLCSVGNGRDCHLCAVWQIGFWREHDDAVFDCSFEAHVKKIA